MPTLFTTAESTVPGNCQLRLMADLVRHVLMESMATEEVAGNYGKVSRCLPL